MRVWPRPAGSNLLAAGLAAKQPASQPWLESARCGGSRPVEPEYRRYSYRTTCCTNHPCSVWWRVTKRKLAAALSVKLAAVPPGQLDISITHCGVCGSDVHQLEDAWELPVFHLSLGTKLSGRLLHLDRRSTIYSGQRVGIGCQRSSWCVCLLSIWSNCAPKLPNLC